LVPIAPVIIHSQRRRVQQFGIVFLAKSDDVRDFKIQAELLGIEVIPFQLDFHSISLQSSPVGVYFNHLESKDEDVEGDTGSQVADGHALRVTITDGVNRFEHVGILHCLKTKS
jgi:hypothetical protein